MRKLLPMMAVLVVMAATNAHAQFANRSLGLGLGYFSLKGADTEAITWGVPITLEGGYYIENGFEVYLRVPIMILNQSVGGLVLATGGQFGVKYLFMEESLRPYVNLHVAGIYIFRDSTQGSNFMGGPGVGGGLDYFVADSISIGGRLYVDLFLALNAPLRFTFGGGANVTTYF